MIPFNTALHKVLHYANPIGDEEKNLDQLLGFHLAEDLKTKFDSPLFDNSSVDGYCVKLLDFKGTLPIELSLIGETKAGDKSNKKLTEGKTIKILTGAQVPKGTDAIVMKEFTKEKNRQVFFYKRVKPFENIRFKGEEFKKKSKAINKGTKITPPVIGLIASLGYSRAKVFKKPKISIIVTGNELVLPGKKLSSGKIYDSNSYALTSCLKEMGIASYKIQRVKDNKTTIRKSISKAIKSSDVIITVGGISVGDYDFVKDVFISLGVKTIFTKIAMKPAKPNYFGVINYKSQRKLIFGLPGNPVSSILSFHQIIKPALLKIMGGEEVTPFKVKTKLGKEVKKKKGRLEFVRGIVSQSNGKLEVMPTKGQGSHMLGGMINANCLINFPKEKSFLSKGTEVEVDFIDWN
ncbi:MAG: molybdopterin molybdotransferase MoeA [Candidatus Melainabacteria bacterium]|nr:molybdopterin molybdotransferase MoeA [Candidatus Melainabacteria bacterium]MBI3309446.1 molybdopterin molybdotransferase MoeA [Candidatus Melainabacteria bacterium]